MSSGLYLWVPFVVLIVALIAGIPVAFAMAVSGAVGLTLTLGWDATVSSLATLPFGATATLTMTTVPMFILMAEFLAQSRIAAQLFEAMAKWLGNIRAGLAMAVIGANGLFGAMSGSSLAAASMLGSVSIPEMRKYAYDERMSLGCVAAAGTFSTMLPPSVALIIYGIATETSIGRLFAAGLLPGVATLLVYVVITYVWATVQPSAAPPVLSASWKQRFAALKMILPVIPLVVLVLGGIYAGLMTPTEAGAIGAAGGLIIAVLLGGLRWKGAREAIVNTTKITSMIILIVVGAGIFGAYLAAARIPSRLIAWLTTLPLGHTGLIIVILAIYVIMGTFMSQTAILLLTLPVTFPIAIELGYSPLWFGIVVIKTVEIGLATPPLGLNVYATHAVSGGKLSDIFRGTAVYLTGDVVVLGLLLAFPWVVDLTANVFFRA